MADNKLADYLASDNYVGFDRYLKLQRKADGWIATRLGITSLGPAGFIVGFLFCYLFFAI